MGMPPAHASWLGDALNRLSRSVESTPQPLQTTSDEGYSSRHHSSGDDATSGADKTDSKSSRWLLVQKTPNYDLYIDKKTMEYGGEGSSRHIAGYFKRQYTPIGSQRLGNSRLVRPDLITHSIYYASFGTEYCTGPSYYGGAKYYDVYNRLIYQGRMFDHFDEGDNWGTYTPDSVTEKLRNWFFDMLGWDY